MEKMQSLQGPTVIGNNVKIGQNTIINSSIIGPDISIPPNQYLNDSLITDQDCLLRKQPKDGSVSKRHLHLDFNGRSSENEAFCRWSKFSYSQSLKRLGDIVGAVLVMSLFAPILPFIAAALKINSPGPLFFKANRQGLHGKEFYCIKFRTMVIDADKMQDRLRVINQMDGPQFKIDDDPRVSSVGRFLRDTFIDEIPQFFNVLMGQMSIVGPRPSPESENTLCPAMGEMRGFRLGRALQVCGRFAEHVQPSQDFQEWIYYDIKYVKKIVIKIGLVDLLGNRKTNVPEIYQPILDSCLLGERIGKCQEYTLTGNWRSF